MSKDLSNMTKEELLEYVSSLKKENASLKQKVTKKDNKIEKLQKEKLSIEKDFYKLSIKFNKLLKKYEEKNYLVKLHNHNTFYTKKENKDEPIIIDEAEEVILNTSESLSSKKRGRPIGSKNFASINWEDHVTETIINEPVSLLCEDCSSSLIKFDEDISYKVKRTPAKIEVIKIITPKYKCPKCNNKIIQAYSTHPFNHSVLTGSLAANIIDAKFNLGVPLYRYSKYLNDHHIPLSTMDLSNYILSTDNLLKPLYDLMLSKLVNTSSGVIFADETPLEILDYQKEGRKNGYIFAYVSSFYDHPIYIYNFSKTRETDKTKDILNGFNGTLVCDGYSGYNDIASKDIRIQRCWAHIRRNFYNISKTLSKQQRENSIAFKMVMKMEKLFFEESKFVEQNLSPEEILNKRHEDYYQTILNDIYSFLHSINPESGTALEKAVDYFLKLENESKSFLEDGHVPLTSNLVERAIKPFTICRRNFLFSKNEKGGESSARLFSLVQSAKANGLVSELYLEYVIDNLNSTSDLNDLLPWSNKLPQKLKIAL